MSKEDIRYPYTYAYDLIRSTAGFTGGDTKLSRGDVSKIIDQIVSVLQPEYTITKAIVCKKLADLFLQDRERITDQSSEQLIQHILNNSNT